MYVIDDRLLDHVLCGSENYRMARNRWKKKVKGGKRAPRSTGWKHSTPRPPRGSMTHNNRSIHNNRRSMQLGSLVQR